MASKPKSMSKIKQILRLHQQGEPIKRIARITGVSKNTVRKYITSALGSDQSLEALLKADEFELERLFLEEPKSGKDERFIDFLSRYDYLIKELGRRGVTRFLLWTEYRQSYGQGYGYSQFCWHLQQQRQQREGCAVIHHQAGDLLYIDFAGQTLEYMDEQTGKVIRVQVLVATLGYSQYSYVEGVASQKVGDLLAALGRALAFFGGVPRGIVPDNLKSAVIKADRYEPSINDALEDFANYYGTAIIPARVASPKDKSLAENMVKHAYRKIYAPLRDQRFYSLYQLNQAVRPQLDHYNQSLFQGRDYSRRELFEGQERNTLGPLPDLPFELKKRRKATVQKNGHVFIKEDGHYYSVPHHWIGQQAMIIYTHNKVSIYVQTHLVASHLRSCGHNRYTTLKEHLPSHLQHYHDRSPAYYLEQGANIHHQVGLFIQGLLQSSRHVEQAYKSCDGVLALYRKVKREELVNACTIANQIQHYSYGFIQRIIANGMTCPVEDTLELKVIPQHDNVRGKSNYQ